MIGLAGSVHNKIEHNFDDFKDPKHNGTEQYRFANPGIGHIAGDIKRRDDERNARQ